jgi:glycosyltransferase involved in cell wall biosynthesis
MRVLHALSSTAPLGGAEVYELATARGQIARGDTVGMLISGPNPGPDGIPSFRPADAAEAGSWIDEFAPDVVHVHGFPFQSGVEAKLGGRPVVRSLHDHGFGCSTGLRYLGNGRICRRAHGPGCLASVAVRGCGHRLDVRPIVRSYREISASRLPLTRAANAVVVYSDFVRDTAVRNGIAGERCHVIPYFTVRAEHAPAPPESRTVAFVGRLTPAKGLDVLIRALALVPSAWDELIVVGDGRDRASTESFLARAGLTERTTMHGWLGAEGVAEAIRGSSVVVVPSRWPEPFGIAGIEAMAQARPVIASAVGGIPEWLDNGETGLLVPPGDTGALATALERLLGDPLLARRFGEEAWRRVERFSPESHLGALDTLYAEVAA